MRNKDILISGASVAGPALAFWLSRYGFTPTIVERAPELRPGGYKVDIRGVAIDVVERMGLRAEFEGKHTSMRGGSYVDARGKHIAELDGELFGFRSDGDLELMRGDLSKILYDATKDTTEYLFGDCITSLREDADGVYVTFANNPPRRFDLVVGADGQHSGVRSLVFGDEAGFSRHLGCYLSIFTVPNHLGLDCRELTRSTPGKIINVYSTKHSTEAKAFFLFSSPELDYDHRDVAQQKRILADAFADADWEAGRLLQALDSTPDFYFDSASQITLPRWSKGRVALIGDAGFCPSPASGQGTSLALVSAYVLAGQLAEASGDHDTAFTRYAEEIAEFVELNQALGVDLAKRMTQGKAWQIWLQITMIKLMPLLPWKGLVMRGIMKPIEEAANSITLKDYRVPAPRR
jgi:2-polyprenyl-6-methoxyphenol hydroxylase-like FAD-dependent oxidoreductase